MSSAAPLGSRWRLSWSSSCSNINAASCAASIGVCWVCRLGGSTATAWIFRFNSSTDLKNVASPRGSWYFSLMKSSRIIRKRRDWILVRMIDANSEAAAWARTQMYISFRLSRSLFVNQNGSVSQYMHVIITSRNRTVILSPINFANSSCCWICPIMRSLTRPRLPVTLSISRTLLCFLRLRSFFIILFRRDLDCVGVKLVPGVCPRAMLRS
mmetsp:Transcript_28086/g.66530  ORF Transcript_28086/g.66530 Transcript_28086/m.66530 type:complete len:212 (-) Transcript_28086:430-1065(-)